jgi:putative sigma-54 modulation protein
MMNIQVQAPFAIDEGMQSLIEERVNKLSTFYERIISAKVFLKEEENRRQQADEHSRTVEIRLEVPGHSLHASTTSDSLEKALSETTEKLRRQLKKFKDQLNGR